MPWRIACAIASFRHTRVEILLFDFNSTPATTSSAPADVSNQQHYSYLIGRKSKKAWWRLAWWLIDMCIVNAFQLWAIGKDAPRQLNFREQLMHTLVELFGKDREAVQASRGLNASVALAKDHHSVRLDEDRDCAMCSHRPASRTRTRFACAKCGVHLCLGQCFVRYHAQRKRCMNSLHQALLSCEASANSMLGPQPAARGQQRVNRVEFKMRRVDRMVRKDEEQWRERGLPRARSRAVGLLGAVHA